ncbi:MAG: ATP-binding protein [Propionibacteriaceae bacterium]|nr:ATP-binding protein [Propionibacteriaceae bacterium]
MDFIGRHHDLMVLQSQLDVVVQGKGADRGRSVIVTGRRRVGKSRLVQHFCDTSPIPSVVFQATHHRNPDAERADFVATVAASGLDASPLVVGTHPTDWNHALRVLASTLPDDGPVIVVIDEVPWLAAMDPSFEGALQTVWDRYLSRKPVLLLLVGSDQSVMESLQDHDRPFFGRASMLRIDPLTPADLMDMTGLAPVDAIDAWLITGGLPQVATSWEPEETVTSFVGRSFEDPLSPLLISAELTLLGEFTRSVQSRGILEALGAGERTFSTIARTAGGSSPLASGTLTPLLTSLTDKRVIVGCQPLSTTPDTRNRRYRLADPYLWFWLSFGARALPLAERGLGRSALPSVTASWPSWRGRAVEPLIRESLTRLCLRDGILDTAVVGGWWNRQNNPEIDLVGADRSPVATRIGFVGSIKWRDRQPFSHEDYAGLIRSAPSVPGAAEAPMVAVSATGFAEGLPLARQWTADDIVDAWR